MDNKSNKLAVRLMNGLETLNLKELNKFVGKIAVSLIDNHTRKNVIMEVAQEEFTREFGSPVRSWTEFAEQYSKETPESFALEAMSADRLARKAG